MPVDINPSPDQARNERKPVPAMLDGLKSRCPNCHEGAMFSGFLKVNDRCPNCGEELHHHRADDFPPYLVIFIVGHIVVTGVMIVEASTDWSMLTQLAIWIPVTIAMSLALLRPLKGLVVGLQWALKMHGFGGEGDEV